MNNSETFIQVGGTPLVNYADFLGKDNYLSKRKVNCGGLYLKLECFNPSGSVKDRAAKRILQSAMQRGELKAGDTVVEATSGNMGISLALLGGTLGLSVRIFMPSGMTRERTELMRKYGAEVVFTPRELGMAGAISEAERYSTEMGAFYTRQFENRDGVLAHYDTTAKEIFHSLGRVPDLFIAGVGTGATLSGIARFFKERGRCRVLAVEPSESAVLSGKGAGVHGIEGIGAGFIPPLLERDLVDEVIAVNFSEAVGYFNSLSAAYGRGIGLSAAAVLSAAEQIINEGGYQSKTAVALLPDGRDRYYSLSL